jgi:hypothetical protein
MGSKKAALRAAKARAGPSGDAAIVVDIEESLVFQLVAHQLDINLAHRLAVVTWRRSDAGSEPRTGVEDSVLQVAGMGEAAKRRRASREVSSTYYRDLSGGPFLARTGRFGWFRLAIIVQAWDREASSESYTL